MEPDVADDARRPDPADVRTVGHRRWRPWWAAPRLDPLQGPVVWVWASMVASVTAGVGMAIDRPSPRTLTAGVLVCVVAVAFVTVAVARRRRHDLVALPARPVTPPARALRRGAVVVLAGTVVASLLRGGNTGWASVAVLAAGLTVAGLLVGLAYRLDVRAEPTG